jgi:hypothetical protein
LSFADKVLKILGEKRGVIIPSDEYEKKAFYGGGTNFSQPVRLHVRLCNTRKKERIITKARKEYQ